MTSHPDVLVIGGGVIGLSVAWTLARDGADVTLLSDGAPGASAAAAGMLCPSFEAMQTGGRRLAAMGARSLALWDGFAEALDTSDPARALGYDRGGVIGVGYAPGAVRGRAVPAPDGIAAAEGVLVAGEGQVDPRLLLAALTDACARAGVTTVRGRAERLDLADGAAIGAALAGDRRVRAGRVVVAAGAGALSPVPLVPVRGRAFLVRNVLRLTRVVRSPSVYLCPKADGALYVGATEEAAGAARDGPAAADGLMSEARWLAPALADADVLVRFDGMRAKTPSELPVIGPYPDVAGLVLAVGLHRNGVLLAPLAARMVADALG